MYEDKIKELRTEHRTQVELSNRILAKYPSQDNKWDEEDRKKFDEHTANMLKIQEELTPLEKHEEQIQSVLKAKDYYGGNREGKEVEKHETPGMKAHSDAFDAFLRNDKAKAREILANSDLPEVKKHALMSSIDSAGGFLAPSQFVPELQKDIAAQSVVPGRCRMFNTQNREIQLPSLVSSTVDATIYSSKFVGQWVNEEDRTVTAQSNQGGADFFGLITIPTGTFEPKLVPITLGMLEDDQVGVQPIVSEALAEAFGLMLEDAVLNGDGLLRKPKGILTQLNVAGKTAFQVASGDADQITYSLFANMNAALPAQYHSGAVWLMHPNTYASILLLAGSANDHPLVQPFSDQTSIYGKPVITSRFMPVEGSNTFPVLLANLRGYALVQQRDFYVRVYDQTTPGMVLIYSRARIGGNILREQYFRLGKCDTSL